MKQEALEKRIKDLEDRVSLLERRAKTEVTSLNTSKDKTLREITKGKKFRNGREMVATIVGYHELILCKKIERNAIKQEWQAAKMPNTFDNKFINSTVDEYIKISIEGVCDLTSTGEEIFEGIINDAKPSTDIK